MDKNKIIMSYEDNILLKIYREYSTDEKINFLIRKLREANETIGKQTSYIQEIKYEIDVVNSEKYKKLNTKFKNVIEQFRNYVNKTSNSQILEANKNLLLENRKLKEKYLIK